MTCHEILYNNIKEMPEEPKICTVEEARKAVYLNPTFQLVDVREESEYDIVRIPNTKLVPMSCLEEKCNLIQQDHPVYLMCGKGKRAKVAADFLCSKGYKDVYVIEGGIIAWIKAGFAVVGDKDKYLEMHH